MILKQPDGQWALIIDRLPNPQQAQGVFAINMATNQIAPQLVLEVAVGHESMPQLTGTDLNKYWPRNWNKMLDWCQDF